MTTRPFALFNVVVASIVISACASVSVRRAPAARPFQAPVHLFVLRASSPPRVEIIDGQPRTVIGRSHPDAVTLLADRILAIVRTRDAAAAMVDAPFAEQIMTAARDGVTWLVLPTILEWREGARVAGEGDRIDLALTLARVDLVPPANLPSDAPGRFVGGRLIGLADVRYRSHASGVAAAFSISDHPTGRLLDSDRFRKAVLDLLHTP